MFQNTTVSISDEYERAKERARNVSNGTLGASDTSEPTTNLSGSSGYENLDRANAAKFVVAIKKNYENSAANQSDFANSPVAKKMKENAAKLRKQYGLSEEEFGSGVSAADAETNLGKLMLSTSYQKDKTYKEYNEKNRELTRNLNRELNHSQKMRKVMDRIEAQEIAENLIGGQLEKEIENRLRREDELAAQRGSYGQLSYGKRRAIAEERMQDSKSNRLLNLVNSLIEEDRQNALTEYQQNENNREKRVAALKNLLGVNQNEFESRLNYLSGIDTQKAQQEEQIARQQQAEYTALKETYDRAFEMSNALGYITPELAEFAGVEAGTPMFKMVEYYGGLEKFYAQLEQDARFKAQELAIMKYNAETNRMRPSYSYGGYSNHYNNSSGLTWNQAKAAWERFSSDFSEKNGKVPSALDVVNFVEKSGYSDDDKNQILLAAGLTPSMMEKAGNANHIYGQIDRAILPDYTK